MEETEDEAIMRTYALGEEALTSGACSRAFLSSDDAQKLLEAGVGPNGNVSFRMFGEVIKKMNPVDPGRLAMEELAENLLRESNPEEAAKLAEAHKEMRILQVIEIGAARRLELGEGGPGSG